MFDATIFPACGLGLTEVSSESESHELDDVSSSLELDDDVPSSSLEENETCLLPLCLFFLRTRANDAFPLAPTRRCAGERRCAAVVERGIPLGNFFLSISFSTIFKLTTFLEFSRWGA